MTLGVLGVPCPTGVREATPLGCKKGKTQECGVGQTMVVWERPDPWGVGEARPCGYWGRQTLGVFGRPGPRGAGEATTLGFGVGQTLGVWGRPNPSVRGKPDPLGGG